jgi:branched-chain amino acid transport system ATP-binding protein
MTTMSEAAIEIKRLRAWYGESLVLQGVDLFVNSGETVALLGRNGAGKTTTLKSIIGILRQRAGEILISGENVIGLPLHKIAWRGVGYVPEERGIFPGLSVDENLTIPPRVTADGLSSAEIYDLFPNLLERRSSEGTKLSGGEQQMLAIARVLRSGARILLLDEVTEGLAPVIVQQIGQVIKALKSRGMTVLLVEQNFRFAQKLADRFYVMEEGRIIDEFTAAQKAQRQAELKKLLSV